MFLAIDVGNTQTTLGLFDEDGSVAHGWRMATSHTDTSDMIDARLHGYFNKDGLDQARVTAAGSRSAISARRGTEGAEGAGPRPGRAAGFGSRYSPNARGSHSDSAGT